jgi:hypothetical protein
LLMVADYAIQFGKSVTAGTVVCDEIAELPN